MNREQQFTEQRALWPFLRRMLTYSWRYKRWMKLFIAWTVLVAVIDAINPLIILHLIDHVLTPEVARYRALSAMGAAYVPPVAQLWPYALAMLSSCVLIVVGIWAFIHYAGRVQERILYDLRQEMFEKLQRLQLSFFDKTAAGWLLTRISSDTDRVCEVMSWALLSAVWGITMIVFCLVAMFWYSWQLACVVLVSIPLMLLASVRIRSLVLSYSRESRRINSDITASYTEHINGFQLIKVSAQEEQVSERFGKLTASMRRASYQSAFYTALYMPIVLFASTLAATAVLLLGGNLVTALPMGISIGVLVASYEYAHRIFEPIVDITRFYATAQSCLSAGERIFGLLDEPVTITDAADAVDFEELRGEIEFRDVNFGYTEGQPVLQNFNLHIPAGQSVALVGATGEGKSTIASLVGRFYEAQSGLVLIDGADYRGRTLRSLRSRMGIVLQTPQLFQGTIADNIRYGRQGATDADIEQSLRLSGAEELSGRMQEQVGENGDNLSLGEKQLVSFARAVIADPAIFIMDEATSSIDTLTEARIQKSINQILSGRTAIIIAHRLSTIKNCDRILVIKKGRIIEDGNHRTLLRSKGHYYHLYTHQLSEERMASAEISD